MPVIKFETKEVERTFTRAYVHQVGGNRLFRGREEQSTPWFTDIGGDLMKGEVTEQWFTVPVDTEWIAAFRLILQIEGNDYVPTLGELRIFPSEAFPSPGPGLWSAEALGLFARVPPGGITARLLRKIKA